MSSFNSVVTPRVPPTRFSPNDGTGTNLLGTLASVTATLHEKMKGLRGKLLEDGAAAGTMITTTRLGNAINAHIPEIINVETQEVEFFTNYKFILNGPIRRDTTLEELRILLGDPRNATARKIAIPLLINKGGVLDKNHFVGVLIDKENNRVEYYNSKGEVSRRFRLNHGRSRLSDFLNICVTTFCEGEDPRIIENTTTQQLDCFHCAAFVFKYFRARISKGTTAEDYFAKMFTRDKMDRIRISFFSLTNAEDASSLLTGS